MIRCKFCYLYFLERAHCKENREISKNDFYVMLYRYSHRTRQTYKDDTKYYFKFCPMCGSELNNYKK